MCIRDRHNADGTRTEPPVSVPSATGTMPAATAAALPALEPPVIWLVRQGLREAVSYTHLDVYKRQAL